MSSRKLVNMIFSGHISQKIGLGAFLCALAIAAFHAPGAWAKLTPAADIAFRLTHPLIQTSLAFFFAVSGFLIWGKVTDFRSYLQIVIKRARTLIVPFVLWNIIFLGCVGLMFWSLKRQGIVDEFASLMPGGGNRWLDFNIYSFVRNCPNPVLWFLRTLFILVLFVPLFIVGITRLGWLFPLCIGIICLVVDAFSISLPFNTLVQSRAVFYFSLGLWWRSMDRNFPFGRFSSSALAFCGYFLSFYSPVGYLMMLLGFFGLLPSYSCAQKLQSFSFPLYMLHYLAVWFFLYLNACFNLVATGSLLWVLACGVFAIVTSLPLIWILHSRCPKTSCVLFGGR